MNERNATLGFAGTRRWAWLLALMAWTSSPGRAWAAVPATPPERLDIEVSGRPIAVWARRPAHPRGVVVLVHGRTWSARTAFDFEPPEGSRSLLRALSVAGFAAYAVDIPGYGATPREPGGWLSPTRSAEVVEAVVGDVARRHPALGPPMLLGWSRGARTSAMVASRGRVALRGLVLFALTYDPAASPAYGPPVGPAPALPNDAEAARSNFSSPDVASPSVVQAFVDVALVNDLVRADVCCDDEYVAIRPETIRVPTLLIQGGRDPGIKPSVASLFFGRLAAIDKRWVVLGTGDHAASLEETAPVFQAAVLDFLAAAQASAGR